ncbi:hypothetical protein BJ912DRAFT_1060132 [Pholiota molesta]|nr:hypothetical protein BJ912DRAFT_1060132 [Pholiota molesta]
MVSVLHPTAIFAPTGIIRPAIDNGATDTNMCTSVFEWGSWAPREAPLTARRCVAWRAPDDGLVDNILAHSHHLVPQLRLQLICEQLACTDVSLEGHKREPSGFVAIWADARCLRGDAERIHAKGTYAQVGHRAPSIDSPLTSIDGTFQLSTSPAHSARPAEVGRMDVYGLHAYGLFKRGALFIGYMLIQARLHGMYMAPMNVYV